MFGSPVVGGLRGSAVCTLRRWLFRWEVFVDGGSAYASFFGDGADGGLRGSECAVQINGGLYDSVSCFCGALCALLLLVFAGHFTDGSVQ